MGKGKNSETLLDQIKNEALATARATLDEKHGGLPSAETLQKLSNDEKDRPLEDVDFFDFIQHGFIDKGVPVEFTIKKDGEWLQVLRPPLSWPDIRQKFGPGTYAVIARNRKTKTYIKQATELMAALPEGSEESTSSLDSEQQAFGFATAPSSSGTDLSAIMVMIQQQNERDNMRRAEERERDEVRRKEDRESRNELLKLLIPTLAPLVMGFLSPKKDEKSELLLEFMRENQRTSQAQTDKLMDKFEKAASTKADTSPLDLIRQLNDARKDGREEMKELMEMVEDKAEARAEVLAQQNDGDDSTLAMLLKSVGPGLAALLAQGKGAPNLAAVTNEEQEVDSDTVEGAVATVSPIAPPKAPKKTPPTPEQLDQQAVLSILFPFFIEQLQRQESGHEVSPKIAARESLNLLKAKGFSQVKVLSLFSHAQLLGVLKAYNLPKKYDSWFNDYYEALATRESAPVLRAKANVSPFSGKTQSSPRRSAPRPGNGNDAGLGTSPGDSAEQSRPASGFIPAEVSAPKVIQSGAVLPAAGASVGAGPEGAQSSPS